MAAANSEHIHHESGAEKPSEPLLQFHPRPEEEESLRGYLFRLTEANFYASPTWFNKLEPSLKRISSDPDVIDSVARLAGLSSLEQNYLRYPYGIDDLSMPFLSANGRICPLCVQEKGFLDAMWDVAFVCACPKHEVLLVDSCHSCGAPIRWNRHHMTQCRCGADLTKAETSKANQQIIILNILAWKIAGRDIANFRKPENLPETELFSLNLNQLCAFYRFLAASALGNIKLNKTKPGSINDAVFYLKNISAVLTDWPTGFHRIIDTQHQQGEGLRQAFGKLYKSLYESLLDKQFRFVQKAFEDYLNKNWTGVLDGKYGQLFKNKQVSSFISTTEARKMLGIGSRQLIKLVDHGVIKGKQQKRPSGRTLTLVSRADVQRYKKVAPYLINGKEANSLLGISKKHLKAFVANEIIKPIVRPGLGDFAQWKFDSRKIRRLLADLKKYVPQKIAPQGTVPFLKVCQTLLPNQEMLPSFFQAIRTGTLPVAGTLRTEEFRLSALCFDPEEITTFRNKQTRAEMDELTIPEFAEKAGLKQEVAYHLVNTGLVPCIESRGAKFKGRMIAKKTVRDFELKYISLAQVAHAQGASMRGAHLPILMRKLSDQGVLPVTGPSVDGCRQVFYRKKEVRI